jgi:hypothetical protein
MSGGKRLHISIGRLVWRGIEPVQKASVISAIAHHVSKRAADNDAPADIANRIGGSIARELSRRRRK